MASVISIKTNQRRLGTHFWRLSDTISGKSVRVSRSGKTLSGGTTYKSKPRILTESEQLEIVARIEREKREREKLHAQAVENRLHLVGQYN